MNGENLLTAPEPAGTFTELQEEINNTIANPIDGVCVLELNKNYTYVDEDKPAVGYHIVINGKITINGNGAVLDADNKAGIFLVNHTDVVLNNITFINAKAKDNDVRAVFVTDNAANCTINNSYFHDNYVDILDNPGGAVYWDGANGTVSNTVFENNMVTLGFDGDDSTSRGGAIFWAADNGTVEYCTFKRNYARDGGAISWGRYDKEGIYTITPENGLIYRCNFTGNSVWYHGMAVITASPNFSIVESNFTNNTGVYSAVLIECPAENANVSHCIFKDNNASCHDFFEDGSFSGSAALETNAPNVIVEYCDFINNTAFDGEYYLHQVRFQMIGLENTFIINYRDPDNNNHDINFITENGVDYDNVDYSDLGNPVWSDEHDDSIRVRYDRVVYNVAKGLNPVYGLDNHHIKNNDAICGIYYRDKTSGHYGYFLRDSNVEFIKAIKKQEDPDISYDNENDLIVVNDNLEVRKLLSWDVSAIIKIMEYYDGFPSVVCYLDSTGSHVIPRENINEIATFFEMYDDGNRLDCYALNADVLAVSFENQFTRSYVGAAKVGDSGIYTVFDNCYFLNNSADWYGAVEVDADNVVMKYSNFTNNTAKTYVAGAVQWSGYNATVLNCTFTNNTAADNGGAIYFAGSEYDDWDDIVVEHSKDSRVINSTFLNNVAKDGGAIYWSSYNGTVLNSSFTENTARNNGGAIYFVGTGEEQGHTLRHSMNSRVVNSTFTNNTANYGGAIYWAGENGNVSYSNFTINSAISGGAIYWHEDAVNGDVSYSNFTGNNASGDGGAILWKGNNGDVSYSNFTGNTADCNGGAVCWKGVNGTVSYSNFADNHDYGEGGGAIFWHEDGVNGTVSYSNFTDNTASSYGGAVWWKGVNGTVSYSNFTGNNASGDGGAIYWNDDGVNGTVSYSNFTNNTAWYNGGAILWKGNNGNVSYSNFTDNYADWDGGAIFWHEDGVNGSVSYSNFTVNYADCNGGAICWKGDNGNVSYSDFTNNYADSEGGAIYWHEDGVKGTVSYSNFTINHAESSGGAILWTGVNGSVSDSNFTGNYAYGDGGAVLWMGEYGNVSRSDFIDNYAYVAGGAISWSGDWGTIFDNCYFAENIASVGGAVNWYGDDGWIENCTFTDNNATGNGGGAIYWGRYSGNDPPHTFEDGVEGVVINCNFTSNNAVSTDDNTGGGAIFWFTNDGTIEDNCYFTDNHAGFAGGAIYWLGDRGNMTENCYLINNSANNYGGAMFIVGDSQTIEFANFTGNTAEYGGAIYTVGNDLTIDVAYFNNNNATSGSAIYKKEGATGYRISNVIFDRNQAHSEGINVEVTKGDKSFAKADVTFEVTFKGKDNIANAIWDEDLESMIQFKNITFDFSKDGVGRELQSFNEEWGTPTSGFVDESSIWQNPCEDAQLVDIIVRDQNGAVILNITNGVKVTQNTRGLLSAKRYDEAEDMIVTDVDGKISWTLPGLSAGTYTIEAVHDEDAYYTRADGYGSFAINEVTKTTEDVLVMINQTVTYNITITNNGDEAIESINITDDYPEELDLLSYQTKWVGPDPHNNWKWERHDGTNIFYITNGDPYMSSFIPEGESVVLILVFKAIEKGTFSNTAKVESYSTLPVVVTSQETTVADVVLNVTKTANVTFTANNTLVNYTVVVNNTGLIDATEVNIVDVLPGNLTYAGKWGIIDANGARITEISALNWEVSEITAGSHVSIWFTANVTAHKIGNITNVVKVSCRENDTEVSDEANVTVLPTITKHVVGDLAYDVNDKVNYTIFIDVTGADLSELVVNDDLDDSFDVVSVSEDWEYDGTKHVFKYMPTTIPDTLTLNFTVKVTKTGKYTNFASIQIGDMPEVTAESEEISVYAPDVNITKTVVEPRTVNVGDQVAFIINVTNTGDRSLDVGEVIVWEDFDGLSGDYIDEIRGQWRAVDAALPYYALESTLDVDDYACFKIYFTTKIVGKLYNTASVENFGKQDSDYVEVLPNITKHVDKSDINVGESVEYSIFIDATGLSEKLVIKDILNESFVLDESSISENWEYDEVDHAFKYKLSDISGPLTLKFKVNITEAGNYTNVASLEINDLPEVTAESEVTRVREVILNVTKAVNGATVVANNTLVNYTINVSNIGDANATLVNIVDVLPGNLTYAGEWGVIEANGASVTNSTLSWEVSNITAGSYVSIWFAAVVNTDVAGVITNVVNVNCSENRTKVSDDADVTVVPVVLNVTKTANATAVAKGVLINYTIVVDNIGPGNATNVNVTDILPDGLIYSRWGVIDAKGATVTNKTLSDGVEWIISNITAGSSITLWVEVKSESYGNLTNYVTVNSTENKTLVGDDWTVEVGPVVLNVDKVVNGATIVANNTLVNYTITVSNVGRINATLVNIVDILPGNLTYADKWGIIEANAADISNTALSWTVSNISAGSHVSIWLAATVNTDEAGNITNVVRVNCKENGTVVSAKADVTVVPVVLNVTKTANVTVVANNTLVNYTIVVDNIGEGNATLVNVVDLLPVGLVCTNADVIDADGASVLITISPGRVEWIISNITAGKSVSLWIAVRTTAVGNFTNNVTVNSKENKTLVKDNETVDVLPVALNVTKTANVTVVANNTLVNYTITVSSIAKVNATLVNIADALPGNLTYAGKWGIIEANGAAINEISPLTWEVSDIAAGSHVSIWFTVTVNTENAGNITNVVRVKCNENDTVVSAEANITVVPVVLNVTKTANVTVVANNTLVNYTIVVDNIGDANATLVNVVDLLPVGLVCSNADVIDADGASVLITISPNGVEWIISNITAGKSVSLWIEVRTVDTGNLTNNVTVNSKENKTLVKDNETVEVLPVVLNVTKTANVTLVSVGDSVEFTLNVTNTGLIEATDINVTDLLNAAFEVQSIGNGTYLKYNDTERIVWNIPSLGVGDSTFFTVVVKVTRAGTFNNIAVVKTPKTDETISTVNVTAKIPTHTTVSNVTTYPDTTVNITVNVTADDGKIINGNVTVYFPDGSNKTVEIINGTGNTTWHVPANYTPGNYTDWAVYDGNETYFGSEGVGNIEVLPIPTHTTVSNVTTYPDTDVDIFVNVTAEDGKPVNGNVTVVLPDGSNRTVLIVNGSGNTTWHVPADYVPGNYSVPAKFEGNETYLPSEGVGNIEVLPIPTHTTVSNVTTYPDTDVDIFVNVTAEDGKPVNGNVTVVLPDGNATVVVIVNGSGNTTWHVPANYTPGNYSVPAKFAGNETYLPSNGTGNIEVLPIPTHTVVGNVTTYPDTDVTVPINVTADDGKPVNGNVTITFPDGTNQTVEIVNGTGNATWHVPANYTPGNYTDFAVFGGNETYLPSNGTGNIEVLPIPTHTVVGNVTTYPDTDVVIPINVTADDNKTISGNVTITFPDGSNQTVEIINGTGNATWHVPANYTPGDYPDFAVFDGNDTYLPSNGTGTITVIPIPTHTTVGNVTAYPGRNVTIPVNVTADDGKPFNGNVTITFPDGTNQTVEIINGTGNATWTVPANYVPGDYPDKDSYAGNDTYLPSNSTGKITVLPIPTTVSIGNITTYPGENVTIPINATVFEDEPFTGNVTVQMPDGSVQTVEIINGTGNITWFVPESYVPDNYTDTIKFIGNETYLPSNNTGNIEVIKIPTHVTIGNVTAYPGEEVKIPINVTADNGKPFNGNVTVKLPDGTNQTVEIINGTGNITWTVPDDYSPDVYNDTIEVIGDEKYLPSNSTGIVEVVRIPTHITVGNVTTFAGRDVTIPINVTADDGKPFTGNVTITLPDGSTKTVEIINGTGTTTWFVPRDYTPDKYPDAVRFDGDVKYLPSEGKGTITVIKIPVDIVVGNVTAHPGDKVTIPIEVIPRDGSLFNDNVTVELPDGTKKVVEIVNGKGSVDWTIPMDYKGDYLVKVSSDDTEVYYPANGTGVITVIVDNHTAENATETPQNTLARHETGNPILALLAVLAVLGISVKRKK